MLDELNKIEKDKLNICLPNTRRRLGGSDATDQGDESSVEGVHGRSCFCRKGFDGPRTMGFRLAVTEMPPGSMHLNELITAIWIYAAVRLTGAPFQFPRERCVL